MKATAKFLFDEDFASGERPTITMVEHERRRQDAESVAYRNGFAAAEAQAHTRAEQQIASALELIGNAIERLNGGLGELEMRLETEAVQVAVAVAQKLAPELIAREPFAEIAALATECFRHLVSTPHVAVRLNENIHAAAKQKLDEIARARGFEGRLLVLADPEIGPGDCRIEWADGGVNRASAETTGMIDDAVARYIAARTAH